MTVIQLVDEDTSDRRAHLGAAEALCAAVDVERAADAFCCLAGFLDRYWPAGAEEARRWERRLMAVARRLREVGERTAA